MIDLIDNPTPDPAPADGIYGAGGGGGGGSDSPSTSSSSSAGESSFISNSGPVSVSGAGGGDSSGGYTQFTPGFHYYGQIPRYSTGTDPTPLPLSPACWSELTSRIFYGDQQELAGDGVLTEGQMRDFYNYSIGVGHEGFDVSTPCTMNFE
jgi:hypothetical protein